MTAASQNPYVGPRTFEANESHLFFGREREALDLLSLVISERLVLFYAQSGAGKSSLINTKLIPGLEAEGEFQILPVGRVGGSDALRGANAPNIFVYNLVASLLPHHVNPEILNNLILSEFVSSSLADMQKPGWKQVLMIDQFEELFSTHLEVWEKREDFFRQLAQAMADFPSLWVVLVMREDYIAYLDPYVNLLPGKLRVRYYMQRLEREAALKAIKNPVEQIRPFASGVAEKLVDDLSGIKTQQPDGTTLIQPGQFVEPVQLQVVCYNLWESLDSDGKRITDDDLQKMGDVSQALEKHYARRVQEVAEQKGINERSIRDWFEKKLISSSGTRNMVLQETRKLEGELSDDLIQTLQSDLVRAEKRGSSTFYELTHDRLVEPILANNRKWREERSSVLQKQAALWDQQGRPDGLLLRRAELAKLEREIKETPPSDEIENSFMNACRRLKIQEDRERQRNRLITMLAIGATIAMFAALFFGWQSKQNENQARIANTLSAQSLSTAQAASTQAVQQRNVAQGLARLALSNQLVKQSKAQLNNRYDLSLLLGIEAYRVAKENLDAYGNLLSNFNTPNLITFLSSHRSTVKSVAFSPDGKLLASASWDDTIILWDVSNPETPTPIGQPLADHTEEVLTVAFSPDGKVLASGSWKELILWDVSNPQAPTPMGTQLAAHTDNIKSVAFSPDGKLLASGSDDKTIILWDVSNPETPTPIGQPLAAHSEEVYTVAFSPDGKVLASGSWDDTIILWDVSNPETPTPIGQPLAAHRNDIESVAFSPDGKLLASGSDDKTIILWDVSNPETAHQIGVPFIGHTDWIWSVGFSPDGKLLASGSRDKTVRLWDVLNLPELDQHAVSLAAHTWVASVNFSPDGEMLASGGGDETIRLWHVSDPESSNQLGSSPVPVHTDAIESVAFSPDGKVLASGSDDDTIILWDVSNPETPTPIGQPLADHMDDIKSVAFSPDGKVLASGGNDDTIILWDVSNPETPTPIGEPLADHMDDIKSVAFSPDGKLLASGSDDKTIILWDVSNPETPTPVGQPLTAHTNAVNTVTFSPDGKVLASGSWKELLLWDVSNPQAPTPMGAQLAAHTDWIWSVAFSPDGKRLASGGEDDTVILWDVSNPLLLVQLGTSLTGHTDNVYSVAFSPDGKTLVSASADDTIRLWNINADSWIEHYCAILRRNFTKSEWANYLPIEDYRMTCPQWPAGQ